MTNPKLIRYFIACLLTAITNFSYGAWERSNEMYLIEQTNNDSLVLLPNNEVTFKWHKHNFRDGWYGIQYTLATTDSLNGIGNEVYTQGWSTIWSAYDQNVSHDGDFRSVTIKVPCDLISNLVFSEGRLISATNPYGNIRLLFRVIRANFEDPLVDGRDGDFNAPKWSRNTVEYLFGVQPDPQAPYTQVACDREDQTLSVGNKAIFTWDHSTQGTIQSSVDEYRKIYWYSSLQNLNADFVSPNPSNFDGEGFSYTPTGNNKNQILHYALFRNDPDSSCNSVSAAGVNLTNVYNEAVTHAYLVVPKANFNLGFKPRVFLQDDGNLNDLKCQLPGVNLFLLPPVDDVVDFNEATFIDAFGNVNAVLPGDELDIFLPMGSQLNDTEIRIKLDLDASWYYIPTSGDPVSIEDDIFQEHFSNNPLEDLGLVEDFPEVICSSNILNSPQSNPFRKTYQILANVSPGVSISSNYNAGAPNGADASDYGDCFIEGPQIELAIVDLNTPADLFGCRTFQLRERSSNKKMNPTYIPFENPVDLTFLVEEEHSWEMEEGTLNPTFFLSKLSSIDYADATKDPNPTISSREVYNFMRANNLNDVTFYHYTEVTVYLDLLQLESEVITMKECVTITILNLPNGDDEIVIGFEEDGPGIGGGVSNENDFKDVSFILFPNPVDKITNVITVTIEDVKKQLPKEASILFSLVDRYGNQVSGILDNTLPTIINIEDLLPGHAYFNVFVNNQVIHHSILDIR